jgi:hypothetical protein
MIIRELVVVTTVALWQRRYHCRQNGGHTTFFNGNALSFPIKTYNTIHPTPISSTTLQVVSRNTLSFQPVNLQLKLHSPLESRGIHQQQNVTSVHTVTSSIFNRNTGTDRFGVTSILLLPTDSVSRNCSYQYPNSTSSLLRTFHVIVGTKNGHLLSLTIEYTDKASRLSQKYPVEWLYQQSETSATSKQATRPIPIYSLATIAGTENIMLLVGSADRNVHVWNKNYLNRLDGWKRTQRLGLHTGWVKDIVVLPTQSNDNDNGDGKTFTKSQTFRLLSIGCNRIESWTYTNSTSSSSGDIEWDHVSSTTIESSNNGALCTLSSDLLCLEVCRVVSSTQCGTIVAVGGVDGRIHFYCISSEKSQLQKISSLPAHQGRVNVLSYDTRQQILISGSHDGTIHCWSLFNDNKSLDSTNECITTPLSSLLIVCVASYQYNIGVRITALSCFATSGGCTLNILTGTQNGSIHLLSLTLNTACDRYELVLRDAIQIGRNTINKIDSLERIKVGPIINTFCRLTDDDTQYRESSGVPLDAFVVGHSQGMGILEFHETID